MISTFGAIFDANVFYGARLRSLILHLAQTKIFRARWSNHIHDEWIRSLLANRPDLTVASFAKTREAMDRAVPDCLASGYEALIPAIVLPDPNDRHVVAAAIQASASCIVTFNLDDFPDDALAPFGLHARHPDDFLLDVQGIDPVAFTQAVMTDFKHYVAPPLDFSAYAGSLAKAGVPKIAAQITELEILISEARSKAAFIDFTPS